MDQGFPWLKSSRLFVSHVWSKSFPDEIGLRKLEPWGEKDPLSVHPRFGHLWLRLNPEQLQFEENDTLLLETGLEGLRRSLSHYEQLS